MYGNSYQKLHNLYDLVIFKQEYFIHNGLANRKEKDICRRQSRDLVVKCVVQRETDPQNNA